MGCCCCASWVIRFVCMWECLKKNIPAQKTSHYLFICPFSLLFMSIISMSRLSLRLFLFPHSIIFNLLKLLISCSCVSLALIFQKAVWPSPAVKRAFNFFLLQKKPDMLIVWCHLYWIWTSSNLFMMSFRSEHNWCNLQGCVNSSVLCVITFVQATMTQWHWNCWVGDAKGDRWSQFLGGISLYVLCTDTMYSSLTHFIYSICVYFMK